MVGTLTREMGINGFAVLAELDLLIRGRNGLCDSPGVCSGSFNDSVFRCFRASISWRIISASRLLVLELAAPSTALLVWRKPAAPRAESDLARSLAKASSSADHGGGARTSISAAREMVGRRLVVLESVRRSGA